MTPPLFRSIKDVLKNREVDKQMRIIYSTSAPAVEIITKM